MLSASDKGLIPIWSPSAPTSRTSLARILSLILGSSAGPAICLNSSWARNLRGGGGDHPLRQNDEADAGKSTSATTPEC